MGDRLSALISIFLHRIPDEREQVVKEVFEKIAADQKEMEQQQGQIELVLPEKAILLGIEEVMGDEKLSVNEKMFLILISVDTLGDCYIKN